MAKCNGCDGHGYYVIHKDAAGTRKDKKKTCGDCKGSGEK